MPDSIMDEKQVALVFKAKKYRELSYALLWGLLILPWGLFIVPIGFGIFGNNSKVLFVLFILAVLVTLVSVGLRKNFKSFTYWGIVGLVAGIVLCGIASITEVQYNIPFSLYVNTIIEFVFFLLSCWVAAWDVLLGKRIKQENHNGDVILDKASKESIALGTVGIVLCSGAAIFCIPGIPYIF